MTAPTILVVDDDTDLRTGLLAILQRRGYATLEAEDGKEARQIIDEQHPDLVVLDMMMPHWGGFAVLDHFQGRSDAPPFVMITGKDEQRLEENARAAGVVDYLHKPFSFDRLLEVVTRTLGSITEPVRATVAPSSDANILRCQCPACGVRVKAPRSLLAQTRPCPGCQHPFRLVPLPPEDEGPLLAPADHK